MRIVNRGLFALAAVFAVGTVSSTAAAQTPTAAPPTAPTPDGPAPTPDGPAPTPDGPASATAPPATAAAATPAPAAAPPGTAPAPSTPPAPAGAPAKATPEASTGFQMAFRFGLSFPFGDATGAPLDTLGARYAWQVPLGLDIGAKIGPNVFIGGYLTYAFGAEGSDTLVEALCDDDDDDLENDVSCGASTFRLGLQIQYHFTPSEKTNGWIGYGAGFESASEYIEDRQQGYSETSRLSGFTVAQLSGGLDLRAKTVGFGPYGELAIGRYTKSSTELNSVETASGDIDDPTWHAWLTVGLRMVLFP